MGPHPEPNKVGSAEPDDQTANKVDEVTGQEQAAAVTQEAPRNFFKALVYRSEEHDENITGLKLSEKAVMEEPMGEVPRDGPALINAAVKVLKRMPAHHARQTLAVLPAVVGGAASVCTSGFLYRVYRNSVPEHEGSGKQLEWDTAVPYGIALLGLYPIIPFITGYLVSVTLMLRSLFKVDVVKWAVRLGTPTFLWILATTLARPKIVPTAKNPESMDRIFFYVMMFPLLLSFVPLVYKVSHANKNPFLWKQLCFLFLTLVGMYMVYRTLMVRILKWPDMQKIIFCGVVNPFLCQLLQVLPARLFVRSLHHNDPSTSWMLMQICLVWEKTYSRLVIASMGDVTMVGVASLASSLGSGIVLCAVGLEDHRVYRLLGKMTGTPNPLAQIEHKRNEAFRTSVYVFDFATELTMIMAFGTFYLAYDVRRADGTAPELSLVLPSMLMQLGLQYVTNSFQILIVSLWHGVDYIVYAQRKCQYWPALAATCMIFPLNMMAASMFPNLLCGSAAGAGTHWQICQ